ncbi:MAG: hypothetical protein HZB59_09860 [Ignavibacteriales bacterium]|nr:hypothetical protein [Ignavibacteriales bacterium]
MKAKKMSIVKLVFDLIEDSNYFLKEAEKLENNSSVQQRFLRASLLSVWSGFEGWINKTCSDLAKTITDITVHEKGFLVEKRIEMKNGLFVLTNSDKYETIENKVDYLLRNFGNRRLDKSNKHWQNFKFVKELRDSIVHPKKINPPHLSISNVRLAIETIKYYLQLLSIRIYKTKLEI